MAEDQKERQAGAVADPETEESTLDPATADPTEVATVEAAKAGPGEALPGGPELTEEQIEQRAMEVGIRPDLLDEKDYTVDEYEEMLSLYEETLQDITEGEIVQATVLGVTENDVILDVGFKSEGRIPLEEFRSPDEVAPGDTVDVFLESLEDDEGIVVLSKKKADFLRVWERIKAAYDDGKPVPGSIKRKIKGGVTVDLMGVDAFLPGSQIALRRVPNVEDLIGNEYEFKILKLNKRRRNIVVSRRVLLEEERAEKREVLKTELEVGQVRKGVVKNITDFGAFIDLGGMDGLLHITDMSWGRIGHPSEVCEIGQDIEVKILDIDWDRERISLGLKQLQPYPWKDVAKKYPVGSRVKGRVVSITNYGAFVELEKGVEGLVHISEMSWTRNVRHPSQLVSINEEIECVVLRVDEEEQKISLGMKQIEEDPWLSLPAKYPPGTKIKGVVRNLTSFGAFVEVEPGIDGLVHISDMSWTRRVQHPSEVVRKGEEVEVIVLSIDPDQKRISLGLKQVDEDPWYELAQRYEPGKEIEGSVVRLLEKGVVVDLGDDVEGFVPISQLGVEEHLDQPSDRFVEGDLLELRVLETDPINRRIVLAVTELPPERPRAGEDEGTEPTETGGEDEGTEPTETGGEDDGPEATAAAEEEVAPEEGTEEEKDEEQEDEEEEEEVESVGEEGDAPRAESVGEEGDAPRAESVGEEGDAPRAEAVGEEEDAPRVEVVGEEEDAPRVEAEAAEDEDDEGAEDEGEDEEKSDG